ncbi:MAG: hypothetical protein JWR07_4000 [Nevskia sp.]|nr:hypothetical protein [Nevskia sp.]
MRYILALSFLCMACDASAHFFGTIYSLPIPFWMYAYGAAAALVVSFALVAYFVNAGTIPQNFRTRDLSGNRVFSLLTGAVVASSLRALSVAALTLTIATGLFGQRGPFADFNMILFWVVFALGFTYLTAVVGDLYALVNPWRVLCEWVECIKPGSFVPRLPYPVWLAYWPALALYLAYIWLELFGHTQPRSLALALLIYSGITAAGAWLFGMEAWFRRGEFFAVFLRLIARMAPFEYTAASDGRRRLQLRQPFIGLIQDSAEHPSLVLFVLFMLSSTAFDGAHDTLPWVGIFWKGIYPHLAPLVAAASTQPYAIATGLYYAWQWAMLALSPFLYYGVYLLFVWLTKLAAGSAIPLRELSLRFAFTLVPIAFVYNITHYYTLLITQAPSLVKLISDPFGYGWNLFGTRNIDLPPLIPGAGFVWHTQVWLILAGHIVSVYLSHLEALKLFPGGRRAAISQVPMLFLMVIFTTVGLWILSLPIAAGQIVQAPPLPSN